MADRIPSKATESARPTQQCIDIKLATAKIIQVCNDDEGDPWIIEDEHNDDDDNVEALMTRTHRLRSGRNNLTVTHSATRSLL